MFAGILTILAIALVVCAFLGLGAVVSAMAWVLLGGIFLAVLRIR